MAPLALAAAITWAVICGISFAQFWYFGEMQCLVGDADPLVGRVAPFITLPSLPIWLTAPEALRQTPRIRRVFDHRAQAFLALPHLTHHGWAPRYLDLGLSIG